MLICIFMMTNNIQHLLMCLIIVDICKCLFRFFWSIFTGLSFTCRFIGILDIFWVQVLLQICTLHVSSLSLSAFSFSQLCPLINTHS